MKRITSTIIGSSLLLWGGIASAGGAHDIDTTVTYPDSPGYDIENAIVGSDTLNAVMDALLADMLADLVLDPDGYQLYLGLGSSIGERALIGGTANAGEPHCAPTDANGGVEGNPGCQEISPMSRELGAAICDDDHDNTAGAGGWTGVNTEAEGMAICKDGIVLVTDNVSLGQYGNDGAGGSPNCTDYAALTNTDNTGSSFPDRGVGTLVHSGTIDIDPPGAGAEDYVIGSGSLAGTNAWKDAVRLIFTGCDQGDGTCANADDRVARCSSELRTKLLASWDTLFEGTDCGSPGNNCPNGLRKAYRRDDGSGTTGAFLEILGVAASTSANLLARTRVVAGFAGDTAQPMPTKGAFCDGGHQEGWFPTNYDGSGNPLFDLGDPIRKPCLPEDDLCAFDGKMPVVRSIRSTVAPDPLDPVSGYPTHQCTKGKFARKVYITSTLKVCPDGTKPTVAGCKFPYYEEPGTLARNFNCMNQVGSRPLTVPISTDGRSYNFVMHLTDGTVRLAAGAGSSALPQVASWRENMAQLSTAFAANAGFAFGPSALGDYVCTEVDATRNIGCLVGKTTCTLGYSGREAAYTTANSAHLLNEPIKLLGFTPSDSDIDTGDYGFARNLWVNATHGFENLTADCLARGGSVDNCANELLIAQEFYNTGDPGNRIGPLCAAAGYIPKSAIECKGATQSAGCGAPTSQVKADCEPF
jgi:hypothetical protein